MNDLEKVQWKDNCTVDFVGVFRAWYYLLYDLLYAWCDRRVYIGTFSDISFGIYFFAMYRYLHGNEIFLDDKESSHINQIEKIYWAMKKAVESNFPQAKFIAHFSHWYEWGCMIYDRFIIDGKDVPQDPVEAMRLHNAVWTLGVRTAIENGGVVNDHHGVGIKLGRLMKEQYGPAMQVFEGLKKSLDPNGIMNPYKLGL